MPLRRSGRTTQLLRAAVRLAEDRQHVQFVVWNRCEVDYIQRILRDDFNNSMCTHMWEYLDVVSYERSKRNIGPVIKVYDHHVVEELDFQRYGFRTPDRIKIALECNGWMREEIIDIQNFQGGFFRMAMGRPLSTLCYTSEEYACDATATVSVVDFRRTDRISKDGLIIFEHKG